MSSGISPEIVPAAIFFTSVTSFGAGMVAHRWLQKIISREAQESAIRVSALTEDAESWKRRYEAAMDELVAARKTMQRLQEMTGVTKTSGGRH